MKPTTRHPQAGPGRQPTTSRGYRNRPGTRTPGNRAQAGTSKQRLVPPLASRPVVQAPLLAQQPLLRTPTVQAQTPTTPATVAPSLSTQVFTAAQSALNTAKNTAARVATLTTTAMMTGGAALASPQSEQQAADAFRAAVNNSAQLAEQTHNIAVGTEIGLGLVALVTAGGLIWWAATRNRKTPAPQTQPDLGRVPIRIQDSSGPVTQAASHEKATQIRSTGPATVLDEARPTAAAVTQHSSPADPSRPTVADSRTGTPNMVLQDGHWVPLGNARTVIHNRGDVLATLSPSDTEPTLQVTTTTVAKEPEATKTLKLPTKPTELSEFKASHILLASIERIFNARGQKADSLLKLDINILRGIQLTDAIRLQLNRLHTLLIAPIAPAQTKIDEMIQNLNNSLNQLETITTNLSQDGESDSDNPDQNDADQDDILALTERLNNKVNSLPSSDKLTAYRAHEAVISPISQNFETTLGLIEDLGSDAKINAIFDEFANAQTQFNKLTQQAEVQASELQEVYTHLSKANIQLIAIGQDGPITQQILKIKSDIETWSGIEQMKTEVERESVQKGAPEAEVSFTPQMALTELDTIIRSLATGANLDAQTIKKLAPHSFTKINRECRDKSHDEILAILNDHISKILTILQESSQNQDPSIKRAIENLQTLQKTDLLLTAFIAAGADGIELENAFEPRAAQDSLVGTDPNSGEVTAEVRDLELDFSDDASGIEIDFSDLDSEPAVEVHPSPALQGDGLSTRPHAQEETKLADIRELLMATVDLNEKSTHHESKIIIAQNMVDYLESGKPILGVTRRNVADGIVTVLTSKEFKAALKTVEAEITRNELENKVKSIIDRLQNRFLPEETGYLLDHNHNLVPVTFTATTQLDDTIARRDVSTVPVSGDSSFKVFVPSAKALPIYDKNGSYIGCYERGQAFRYRKPDGFDFQRISYEAEYINIEQGISVLETKIASRDEYDHMVSRFAQLKRHPQPSTKQNLNTNTLATRLNAINPETKTQKLIDKIIEIISDDKFSAADLQSAKATIAQLNGHAATYATERQLYFVHFIFPVIVHARDTFQRRDLSKPQRNIQYNNIRNAIIAIRNLRDEITQAVKALNNGSAPEDIKSHLDLIREHREPIRLAATIKPESYQVILRKTNEVIQQLEDALPPESETEDGQARQTNGIFINHETPQLAAMPPKPDKPTATTGSLATGQVTPSQPTPAPQTTHGQPSTSVADLFTQGVQWFSGIFSRNTKKPNPPVAPTLGRTPPIIPGFPTTPGTPGLSTREATPRPVSPAPEHPALTPRITPPSPEGRPIKGPPFNIKGGLKTSDNLSVTWTPKRHASSVTADIRFGNHFNSNRPISPNEMKRISLSSTTTVADILRRHQLETTETTGQTRLKKNGRYPTNTDIKNFVRDVASGLLNKANQNPTDQNRLNHFMTFVSLFGTFNIQHLTVSVVQVQDQNGFSRPVALIQSKGNEIRNVNYVVDFFHPDATTAVPVVYKGIDGKKYTIITKATNIEYNNGARLKYDEFDPGQLM